MLTHGKRLPRATGFAALTLLVSLSARSDAAERVVVAATPEGGKPIVAKTDAAGTIHLALDSADGPRYAQSSDGGKTFSKLLPLVDAASRRPGLEFTVWDLVIDPSGCVHVALGTNAWKLKLPKEEWGCFYVRLDADATAFTAVKNINRQPSEGFSLAADERGNVTACWLADKLYANVSHDHGATFEPTVEINTELNPCNCCTTSATYGADGRLAILYREETNNDRDMFVVLWDQKTGQTVRRALSTIPWKVDACPMTYYSITRRDDGYLAAWPTKGRIYVTSLDRDGKRLLPAEIKTPGNAGMRTGVLALAGGKDTTLVLWNGDGKIGWQLYDGQFRPLESSQSATSHGKGAAGVALADGRFVVFR